MQRTTRFTIAGVTCLALVLTACGDDDDNEAAVARECAAVGTDLEGDATESVEIALDEYGFGPAAIDVDAGTVTFATSNEGEELHELAFLPGGGEVPFTDDGAPDEDALADADAFELEAYSPGQDCNATYALDPGTYTLFCIVEAPDGVTHYEKGMVGTLTVN